MKIFKKSMLVLVFVVISSMAFEASAQSRRGCNPASDPHSFFCQQESFFGRLFPMAPATRSRLSGNWRTLVYAPAPSQPARFRPRVSKQNPRIPTGIVNPDSSVVGTLFWPAQGTILFAHFGKANNHMTQSTQVAQGDAQTVQLGFHNPSDPRRNLLTCRIFVRNRNDHLLCQWMRDGGNGMVLMGYFGFVR